MPKHNIWFISTPFRDFSSDIIKDSIYICFLLKKFCLKHFCHKIYLSCEFTFPNLLSAHPYFPRLPSCMFFLLLSPKKNSKTLKTGQTTKKSANKQKKRKKKRKSVRQKPSKQTTHTYTPKQTNKQTWSLLCVGQLPLSTGHVLEYA